MSQIKASSQANLRELAHLRGIILMRKGAFQDAIDLFLNASRLYGHHVHLLIDLSACYYLTGQKQSWLRILDIAEYEFKSAGTLISEKAQISFQLTLGKMREEQGALAEAIQVYDKILEQIRSQQLDGLETEKYLKALSQVLRLKSLYGLSAQCSGLYKELIQHSASETNWDTAFEIEHALLIFETREIGAEVGELRLEKLFKNPLLQTPEARLIFSDFIYELILLEQPIPESLCERLAAIGQLRPYEQAVLDFARNQKLESKDLLEWPEAMSPSENLRLLSLCMKRQHSEIAEKLFLLLIRDFSEKTAKIWLSLTETKKLFNNASYTYDPSTKLLMLSDLTISLKSKPAYQEMIELLLEGGPLTPEKAVQRLWNGDGLENDISRLRMRVRRLNSEINKAFGRGDFLTLTNREICFAQVVSIHRSRS
jgi:tetratricopeptide (TPR) repeat protein